MTEDKKCRPIIFYSHGPNIGQQEPFPVGSNVRSRTYEEENPLLASFNLPGRSFSDDRKSRLRSLSCNQGFS